MKTSKNASYFKRWQVLYFLFSFNLEAIYLLDIIGYSKANIYAIVSQLKHPNKPDVYTQKRGGRRISLLKIKQECKFMIGLEQKALEGQIISYLDIKNLEEKEIERVVSDYFIWDLFK